MHFSMLVLDEGTSDEGLLVAGGYNHYGNPDDKADVEEYDDATETFAINPQLQLPTTLHLANILQLDHDR